MEIATEIRNNTLPNGYIMMFIRRVVSLIQNKQLLYMINTYKECAMTEFCCSEACMGESLSINCQCLLQHTSEGNF